MKEVYVVEAARTSVAKAGKQGWFANKRAEAVAHRFNISRATQDQLAMESHQKCAQAQAANKVTDVLIPIQTKAPALAIPKVL